MKDEPLEFVFSFRSPFAWITVRQVFPMMDPSLDIRWRPFFPLPSFPNFGNVPAKLRYNLKDLIRLTKAYGLTLGRPPREDPDWSIPHAAFLGADREGAGAAFGLALMEERWVRGEDVATEPIIARAAESVELDPSCVLDAARDTDLRRHLTAEIQHSYTERGIFGVPMLITPEGDRYWGHDRIEWAIRYGLLPCA